MTTCTSVDRSEVGEEPLRGTEEQSAVEPVDDDVVVEERGLVVVAHLGGRG